MVSSGVGQTNRLAFDRNAPFTFNIHAIENLVLKIPVRNNVRHLNKPVGQSGFTVIDMGDNAEISDILHLVRLYGCEVLGILVSLDA